MRTFDATTGAHVWAERYDRDLTDMFAVQDEGLESLNPGGAIPGPAVEVLVGKPLLVEPIADDRQDARELREDEDLVLLLDDLSDRGDEHVELGAGLVDALGVDEPRMARRLA